jgi:hypothetical protein
MIQLEVENGLVGIQGDIPLQGDEISRVTQITLLE